MFKKAFTVKSSSNQRNSDRKKLLARFPPESTKHIPPKATFSVTKALNFQNHPVNIFFADKTPIFFEADGDENIYPTVYFLWNAPTAVPLVLINENVLGYIENGADLMLPGVYRLPNHEFPELLANAVVSIGVYSEKHNTVMGPVAVAKSVMTTEQMRATDWKGRGFTVVHIHHDFLWEAGPKGNPPIHEMSVVFPPTKVEDESDADIAEAIANALALNEKDNPEEQKSEPVVETPAGRTVEENDEQLKKIFYFTLKQHVDSSTLPIDAGQFYALYILKKLPSDVKIDLKKTSFKKFSTFLKKVNDFHDEWIIKVESKKGLNFEHPLVTAAQPMEGVILDEPKGKSGRPRISECYSVTEAVLPIIKDAGYRKGDIMQPNELREVVLAYANKHNILRNNGKGVELNDTLQTLLRHFLPDTYQLNTLVQQLGNQMTKAVVVTLPDGRQNVKRNKVEKRSGNKTVTLLNSFTFFGIDPKELAQKVQTAMATGASINTDVPNCEGPQLLVHGNHVNYIGELLQNEYSVPKKYIKGLELGIKPKKGKK